MKPLQLTLNGFITYRDRIEIDFERFESGLFIISGPTGAGKSTIFDAISYALYGKVSSSRRSASDDAELRCQYLNEQDPETFVDLTFMASGQRWRIVRKPTQTLQSTIKVRNFSSEAQLYRYHQGDWESVSEKIKEIAEYIEEAVGLSHEQFTKIVLLPQGEFTAFLSSDSKNKIEILRRIFGTQSIQAFEERVKSETSEIVRRTKNVSEKIDDALAYISKSTLEKASDYIVDGKVDPVHYHEFAAILSQALEENEQAILPLKKFLMDLNTKLSNSKIERDQAMRNNQLIVNFQATESALLELKKLLPQMTIIKNALDEIKKWDGYLQVRDKKIEAEKVIEARQEDVIAAENLMKEAEDQLLKLREAYDGLPKAKLKLLEDRERLVTLREKHAESLQIQKDMMDLEAMKSDFKVLQDQIFQRDQAQAKRKLSLENLGNTGEELNRLYDLYRQIHTLISELDKRWAGLIQFQELTTSINIRLQANAQTLGLMHESKIRFTKLESEKALLDLEVQKQGLTVFRSLLHDHQPCPLCGSKNHPQPIGESDPRFKLKQESVEEELKRLQRQIISYQASMDRNEQEIQREQIQISQIEVQLRADPVYSHLHAQMVLTQSDFLSPSVFWDLDTNPSNYEEQLHQCQDLHKAYQGLADEVTSLGKVCREKDKESKMIQNAFDEEKSALDQKRLELQRMETSISMKIQEISRKSDSGLDTGALETSIEDLGQVITREDQRIQEIENAHKNASMAQAGSQSGLKMAKKMLLEAQAAYKLANQQWLSLLQSEGISDREFIERGQDLDSIRGREGEVQLFEQKLATQQGAYESQKKMVKGMKVTDLEQLDDQIKVLEEKWTSSNDQYMQMRECFVQDRQQITSIQAAMTTFGDLLKKRDQLQNFDRVLRGQAGLNNGLDKLDFETYVLVYYFETMLQYANSRLYKMTDGQYELVRKTDLGRQGRQGLDIDVIDIYTGKQRSSATLSGGESFLASLALALGLSDELTSRSGGKAIETLFIDEGFGTLDSETLQKATEVLMDLTENNCLIGLISHVEDLVDVIPNRIDVIYEKDRGSHIKITRG